MMALSYEMISEAIEKTNQINHDYKTFADSTLSTFYILTRNTTDLIFDLEPHKSKMSSRIWLETFIDIDSQLRLCDVINKYKEKFFNSDLCANELSEFYLEYPDIVELLNNFD